MSAPRRRPALVPAPARAPVPARELVPAQEPADPRCDYIPVPPVGYDDEGYPVEDSVGQSLKHMERTCASYWTLRDWCRGKRLGQAFSDVFMPYRQGQKSKTLCPDLMVALRTERREEWTSYRLWEHPTPDFALEALSNSTWKGDVREKKRLYRSLGVREYWLFDPSGKRIGERLRGYRLRPATESGGREVHVYVLVRPSRRGRRASEALGLELFVRDDELRFYDPVAKRLLPTWDETEAERDATRERADREQAAREAAERRAETERAERQAAERRAEAEREAADGRIAALEAKLRALGHPD